MTAFFKEKYSSIFDILGVTKLLPICLLFISFLLVTSDAFAQHTYILDKTTRFDRFAAEEGLSSGYTKCMHQDKYGFIWIGSENGLNFYDGYNVKIFNADPQNPKALFSDFICAIYEDADGIMWFSTGNGLSKYERATQTFKNFIPDSLNVGGKINYTHSIIADGDYLWVEIWPYLYRFNTKTEELKSFAPDKVNPSIGIYGKKFYHLFKDGSGVIWVGSGEPNKNVVALSKYNKEAGSFKHFIYDSTNAQSLLNKEVASMTEDKDGRLWFATWGGGLFEMVDKEKGKFKHYTHSGDDTVSLLNNELLDVFEDDSGSIWIGGGAGFSKLNKETGKFINYKIPPWSSIPSLPNYISNIKEDENGEFWLAAYDGFFRFNTSKKLLRHYLHNPENQNSLSANIVTQILHDRSDQVWILTSLNGINRLNHLSNSFQKVAVNSYDKNTLSSNYILRMLGDSKGNLWVGTLGRGLNKAALNNSNGYTNFEFYESDPENSGSISDGYITSIYEDDERTIWIGANSGLNRYNANTNDFTLFEYDPDDPKSIMFGNVNAILEDSHGTFWVATSRGLNIMDRETGEFFRYVSDKDKPGTNAKTLSKVLFEDSYGELWLGGRYLEKLNRSDTSFINCNSEPDFFGDFKKNDISDIIEDDSANLWISTFQDGLSKFNRIDSTFSSFSIKQGLPSNTISAIEIDDRGFIWVSTSRGLSRIDPNDYSIKNFDVEDGLISLEFIDRSSYKDKDGWLYFGGKRGFNVFHPDSIKDNTFIPPVYITALNIAEHQKYFDKPLYEMAGIELQYNENDFSFDYVALNYINSQKNQYAYMLEGYDEDWIDAGNKRTATYTNMSPGAYTFRVKGSNNDGYWNEEGASLAVLIYPPIWKTWWAYVIYVLTFFGLLALVRRNELKRINLKQELELEHVQAEQLAELDMEKNKFFSNISHEFRTPLTLILGPLDRFIGRITNESQKEELNLVRRNARRLQTLINQLLSLSKLESGKMKLKARPENIVRLTRLFLESFQSMADDRGIQLVFESDAEEHTVYVDTLKYEKIANNLLSNAFKFTERGGKIKVSVGSQQSAVGSQQLAVGSLTLTDKSDSSADRGLPTVNSQEMIIIKFSDTGIGIQKEKLPHVFDRFYQVDEQQMKTNLGTGIGLALTKELVELHHGTISVDSEAGMGTTFTLFLPMGKDHLLEDEIFESDMNGLEMEDDLLNDDYVFTQDVVTKREIKSEKVVDSDLPLLLIVEDNEDMRAYIKSYLVDSYQILEAVNGKEGAELAIEHLPDLIISDLMMPFMDGNEMTNQLKNDERTSHIPIILLTARSSTASKLEGLQTGADDFLTKPFDADELLVRIKNLIEQRQNLRRILSQHIGDKSQTRLIKELSGKAMNKLDEQFLEKAKNIVDDYMADPDFSVELFANKMGMSRTQLHRKLTSLTDNSAGDLIKEIRLAKAAELLRQGEMNVTQVSYEIGISSLSYFAKSFKEKYGVSPSEFS